LHITSVRTMKWLRSVSVSMLSGAAALEKLGQPQPLSSWGWEAIEKVKASIAAHDPQASRTIVEAQESVREVAAAVDGNGAA